MYFTHFENFILKILFQDFCSKNLIMKILLKIIQKPCSENFHYIPQITVSKGKYRFKILCRWTEKMWDAASKILKN